MWNKNSDSLIQVGFFQTILNKQYVLSSLYFFIELN